MGESTLDDYNSLAYCVILGANPILPKPDWGQDCAYIAFVIDGLRKECDRLLTAIKMLYNFNMELEFDVPKDVEAQLRMLYAVKDIIPNIEELRKT